MTRLDALVVGAGPAGAVAALVLARAGIRVRLVDRARFPRHKLCGDTVNPGALSILDRFPVRAMRGADCAAQSLGEHVRWHALPVTGMTVTGPHGEGVTRDYPAHVQGAAVARHDLDCLLLEAAVAEGAEVEHGVRVVAPLVSGGRVTGVRVAGAGGEGLMHASVVIAADGRGSRVAGLLGLARFAQRPRRWAFGRYYTGVEGLTTRGEMHLRRHAYIGLAPLPGGVANVCVVRALPRGVRVMVDRATIIRDVIASDPLLRERFAGASPVSDVTTLGPLAIDAEAAGIPGLLLAGDAAGFIDPMTGDGLRFAFRGGELAAEAALSEIASGRPAHLALGSARAREFGVKWRVNRTLRLVAGSPRALSLFATLSAYWSQPVRYLIGVAGDLPMLPDGRRSGPPRPAHRTASAWQPIRSSQE